MRLLLSLLIACLSALPARLAVSQTVFKPGATVTDVLQIDGKQIALPEGRWVVAADGDTGWNDPTLGTYGYLRGMILFRIVENRIDTILEANTNALPTIDGWGTAAGCGRKDVLLSVIRYRAGWDGSCYFVTHSLISPAGAPSAPAIWRDAAAYAASRNWTLPQVALTAAFRSANRTDVLDIRYHFTPETRGLPAETLTRWKDSAWAASRIDPDIPRASFARTVTDWSVGYSPIVDAGLKRRAPTAETIPMPDPARKTPLADLIAQRKTELLLMQQAGTITEAEYVRQYDALQQHGLGTSSTAPDIGTLTGIKALSYRAIVSVSHLFVDYYWTGNYVAAGALEVLQITINSAKFYVHELGWAKYMGLPRTDAARVIDFKYIATIQ